MAHLKQVVYEGAACIDGKCSHRAIWSFGHQKVTLIVVHKFENSWWLYSDHQLLKTDVNGDKKVLLYFIISFSINNPLSFRSVRKKMGSKFSLFSVF